MDCIKTKIWLFALLFILPMPSGVSASETAAAIAVAANGPEQRAMVSEKAGRAAYFLFFDGKGLFLDAEINPFADAPGGAGPRAAAFLADKGVTLVVAKEFGVKMERALDSFNIKYIITTGVSHEVVKAVIQTK